MDIHKLDIYVTAGAVQSVAVNLHLWKCWKFILKSFFFVTVHLRTLLGILKAIKCMDIVLYIMSSP